MCLMAVLGLRCCVDSLLAVESRGCSSSQCPGFSCHGAQAPGARASGVMAPGLSWCSSRALERGLTYSAACGIEPVSSALAGGLLY